MKLLLNDSSVLLNLLAADCLVEVSSDLEWQFAICPAVRNEVTKLRDAATGEMVAVDLGPLIGSGSLQVLELEGDEEALFYIEQAMVVDDGEAMSMAIAASRGIDLAIDDRQAANHARRAFPKMRLWSTPEILKHWVGHDGRLRRSITRDYRAHRGSRSLLSGESSSVRAMVERCEMSRGAQSDQH